MTGPAVNSAFVALVMVNLPFEVPNAVPKPEPVPAFAVPSPSGPT